MAYATLRDLGCRRGRRNDCKSLLRAMMRYWKESSPGA